MCGFVEKESGPVRWSPFPAAVVVAASLVAFVSAQPPDGATPAPQPPVDERRTDELSKRLLRGSDDDGDPMSRILADMKRVEDDLKLSFDAGPGTQSVQQRIVDALNAAIAASARSGRLRADGASAGFDPRRRNPGSTDDASGSASAGGQPPDAPTARGTADADDLEAPPAAVTSRGWGHLPPRERDEVIQGAREPSLEKFREWIERYYRSLADGDRP